MKMLLLFMVVLPLCIEATILSSSVDKVKARIEKLDALKENLDAFKVTWGIFDDLPRTVEDAVEAGWVLTASCSDNPTNPFLGNRYVKDGDISVMPLYDKNGYIAGIQGGVPKNLPNGYPHDHQRPPFVEHGHMYIITVYFVEPSTICSTGRTQAEFNNQGTANRIWLQNSTNPLGNMLKAPARECQIAGTPWVKGKCVPTMGVHYWYSVTADMDCKDFQPIFLLYNGGKLNAFGWALGTGDLSSPRWEQPPLDVFPKFFEEPPTCIHELGPISSMHIYLRSFPRMSDWC